MVKGLRYLGLAFAWEVGAVFAVVLAEIVQNDGQVRLLDFAHAMILDHPFKQFYPAVAGQALLGDNHF